MAGGGWQTSVPTLNPRLQKQVEWEGTPCRNSVVLLISHLQIDHQWSDQHHLGCFRYS